MEPGEYFFVITCAYPIINGGTATSTLDGTVIYDETSKVTRQDAFRQIRDHALAKATEEVEKSGTKLSSAVNVLFFSLEPN